LYLPYNPNLKNNSRNLRKAGNLSEVLLWKELRADKFLGYSFYRQKPILNYIVDFYCKELGLVIEIDGSSHDDKIEYDTERDRQMSVLGLTVLRIKDADVKKDMQNVLRVIENQIGELTPPNPLREGELTPPKPLTEGELTPPNPLTEGELKFSPEATEVFDAGRELWKYYHSQPNCNVNASLYDIREHFQGRNDKGKMNNKSKDESYMKLITNLRDKLKRLAQKIEPKVYEYGFLKE
jgi:very-short-patch-repair endonuclease